MVRKPLPPVWAALQQGMAGGADDQQAQAGRQFPQAVDGVQRAVVRPMQVFEENHHRTLFTQPLEILQQVHQAAVAELFSVVQAAFRCGLRLKSYPSS